ncbi:MAG: hypothetical protein ACFE9T_14265 [Promethearchaeota archaeon]
MQYCSCGLKHKFSNGVIIKDDRKNYEWNCTDYNSNIVNIQEEILANYIKIKVNEKNENSLLIYE